MSFSSQVSLSEVNELPQSTPEYPNSLRSHFSATFKIFRFFRFYVVILEMLVYFKKWSFFVFKKKREEKFQLGIVRELWVWRSHGMNERVEP